MYWLRSIVCVVVDSCQMSSLLCYWAHTSSMVAEQRLPHNDLQQCALIHHDASRCAIYIVKRNRPEGWESVRQASKEAQQRSWLTYCTRETVLLLDEGCLQYTSLGIRIGPRERHVNEFKATWRRMDTSEQPRIQVRRSSSLQESPTLVNKRMPPRCLRNTTTVMLWNGAVSTDREHLEGFKKVVYTRQEQVCDVLQWSRETIPMSIGVGSALDEVKSAWYPMWNRRQLGVEQRRIQLHDGWKENLVNAEHSQLGKKHYYMSDSVPVKRVTAVLHAREDVQRASSGDSEGSSPEGVNAEVWRKQARNTNLALVSDMTWYLDLCWKDDLVNIMSGTWVVRSTRSERKRLSSSVERSIPRQQWSS